MTQKEARDVLREYLTWARTPDYEPEPLHPDSDTLNDAIEMAIAVLTILVIEKRCSNDD